MKPTTCSSGRATEGGFASVAVDHGKLTVDRHSRS